MGMFKDYIARKDEEAKKDAIINMTDAIVARAAKLPYHSQQEIVKRMVDGLRSKEKELEAEKELVRDTLLKIKEV